MRKALLVALALAQLAGCIQQTDHGNPVAPDRPTVSLLCATTLGWPEPCSSKATVQNGPANENWLAVNPTDPRNVVVMAKDYGPQASDCVWIGVMVTHDGGATWRNSYLGGSRAERQPTDLDFGYSCNTDPMFAFDRDGTLYAVQELYGRVPPESFGLFQRNSQIGGNLMLVGISHDGGDTFGGWVPVYAGEGQYTVIQDRTMLVADPAHGSLHFCWSERPNTDPADQVLVATTRDAGATWSAPVLASPPAIDSLATMAVLPDGTLAVFWMKMPPGTEQVVAPAKVVPGVLEVATSVDDGRTFSAPRDLGTFPTPFGAIPTNAHYYVAPNAQVAVDARQGAVYVAINTVEGAPDHPRMAVELLRSADGGATWSSPQRMIGGGVGAPNEGTDDQFHGAVAVGDDGTIYVTYFDTSYAHDGRLDLTLASAPPPAPGAELDFARVRLTQASFDGDLGYHQSGVPFIGDYNGLGIVGHDLYASFPDTVLGRSDIAVAHANLSPFSP